MKKLIILVVLLFNIENVNALNINVKTSNYFINYNGQIIKMNKYTERNLGDIFIVNEINPNLNGSIMEYNKYTKEIGLKNEIMYQNILDYIYFGYDLHNNADIYYYIVQILIYREYYNANIFMCDSTGRELKVYTNIMENIKKEATNNVDKLKKFHNETLLVPLGSSVKIALEKNVSFKSSNNNINLTNIADTLEITPIKEGVSTIEYGYNTLELMYKYGNNIIVPDLGLPSKRNYNVSVKSVSPKLKIRVETEEFLGDANISEIKYGLFENDNLIQEISLNQEEISLINNRNYVLKELSSPGFIKNNEYEIKTNDDLEYNLTIKKDVIKNKISFKDLKGKIYLKRTNEFVSDFDNNEVILPYGEYYFIIDNQKYDFKVVKAGEIQTLANNCQKVVNNPRTNDEVIKYCILLVISIIVICLSVKHCKAKK